MAWCFGETRIWAKVWVLPLGYFVLLVMWHSEECRGIVSWIFGDCKKKYVSFLELPCDLMSHGVMSSCSDVSIFLVR